MYLAHI